MTTREEMEPYIRALDALDAALKAVDVAEREYTRLRAEFQMLRADLQREGALRYRELTAQGLPDRRIDATLEVEFAAHRRLFLELDNRRDAALVEGNVARRALELAAAALKCPQWYGWGETGE